MLSIENESLELRKARALTELEKIVSQSATLEEAKERCKQKLIELVNQGVVRSADEDVQEIKKQVGEQIFEKFQDELLIQSEKNAWKKVLGVEVEVPSMPVVVTSEVKRSLEHLGFELRYIPKLDLGTLDDLKQKSVEQFLDDIQHRYTSWRRYETLSESERQSRTISRNLGQRFWSYVKEGIIDFPVMSGKWVAIEKQTEGRSEGYMSRFNWEIDGSWDKANRRIQTHKRDFLEEVGLPVYLNVRMLEIIEWNLLANREDLDIASRLEWTNSVAHAIGGSYYHVRAGRYESNDLQVDYCSSFETGRADFRIAIIFEI